MDIDYQIKECPRCGKTFTCTGTVFCWCFEVTIPERVRDYIAARYEGCLCKECIDELVARQKC
jgi:hypothetical protein